MLLIALHGCRRRLNSCVFRGVLCYKKQSPGDNEVDRLMKIKSMYGFWPDRDNRRFTASEYPGVHATELPLEFRV